MAHIVCYRRIRSKYSRKKKNTMQLLIFIWPKIKNYELLKPIN